METLGKLFGSEAKVKIIRLFLFNPETIYDTAEIADRTKEDIHKVRRELQLLLKIVFLKQRVKRGKHGSRRGFILNQQFTYLNHLQSFLISSKPLQPKDIIRKVAPIGNIKLVVVAGTFTHDPDSRADILIVGDNLKKTSVEHAIKKLEAEIGKELKYAYFSTPDFIYRLNMYDKLVKDILDYPHQKIVNKLAVL